MYGQNILQVNKLQLNYHGIHEGVRAPLSTVQQNKTLRNIISEHGGEEAVAHDTERGVVAHDEDVEE